MSMREHKLFSLAIVALVTGALCFAAFPATAAASGPLDRSGDSLAPTVEPDATEPGETQSFLDALTDWILRFTPWGGEGGPDDEDEDPSDHNRGGGTPAIDPLGHRPGKS